MNIKFGDKVKSTATASWAKGLVGEVVSIEDNGLILVEYPEKVSLLMGHDGGGKGKRGCCRWLREDNLVRISRPEEEI